MLVYLDSSALLKRVLEEPFTDELRAAIDEAQEAGHEMLTSTLGWIEVTRALRRRTFPRGGFSIDQLENLAMSGVSTCPVTYEVVSLSRRIGPSELRSFDAVHCATAMILDADRFVSYDDRQLAAAESNALAVVAPGREASR